VAKNFDTIARSHLEGLLEAGEWLQGVIAATHQKTFSGSLYAIGVTDRRLILQPLGRRAEPEGEPASLRPEDVVSADAEGAGGGWWTETAVIMDSAALTVKLRTADGERMKLMMMRGGDGGLGKLGGGERQQQGIEALAAWLGANLGGG
jgi:hypothetical protein